MNRVGISFRLEDFPLGNPSQLPHDKRALLVHSAYSSTVNRAISVNDKALIFQIETRFEMSDKGSLHGTPTEEHKFERVKTTKVNKDGNIVLLEV